jgi:hypothetical protein
VLCNHTAALKVTLLQPLVCILMIRSFDSPFLFAVAEKKHVAFQLTNLSKKYFVKIPQSVDLRYSSQWINERYGAKFVNIELLLNPFFLVLESLPLCFHVNRTLRVAHISQEIQI